MSAMSDSFPHHMLTMLQSIFSYMYTAWHTASGCLRSGLCTAADIRSHTRSTVGSNSAVVTEQRHLSVSHTYTQTPQNTHYTMTMMTTKTSKLQSAIRGLLQHYWASLPQSYTRTLTQGIRTLRSSRVTGILSHHTSPRPRPTIPTTADLSASTCYQPKRLKPVT